MLERQISLTEPLIMSILVQIVPALPPVRSGVGDYAVLLGKAIESATNGGVKCVYVAAGHARGVDIDIPSSATLAAQTPAALVSAIQSLVGNASASVLFHAVGYGYDRRGVGLWTIGAIKAVKSLGIRITTMFHELYANGMPWNSSFWLSPLMRHVTFTISRNSHAVITNRNDYAQRLKNHLSPNCFLLTLPVFSTVGEEKKLVRFENRDRIGVVFGSESMRYDVYKSHEFYETCLRADLHTIIDVGASVSNTSRLPPLPNGVVFEQRGELKPSDVRAALNEARYAFLNYYNGYLAKSSVFAAYAAHANVPVIVNRDDSRSDGLIGGVHYARGESDIRGSDADRHIAESAASWYAPHSLNQQVKSFLFATGLS